ncbi:Uncharacterised protein [Halioglobus japonicus]|nr:Uncharacterised protein [Halioglobus japonicus]
MFKGDAHEVHFNVKKIRSAIWQRRIMRLLLKHVNLKMSNAESSQISGGSPIGLVRGILSPSI